MNHDFQHRDHLLGADSVITTKLGTAPTDEFNKYGVTGEHAVNGAFNIDIAQDSTMVACAAGEEIFGFLYSVNEGVLYNQRKVGGVQTAGQRMVEVTGAIAIGDLVVGNGTGGVQAGAPVIHKWMVIADLGIHSLTGNQRVTVRRV